MGKAEEYRRRAEACDRHAKNCRDLDQVWRYRLLAQEWRNLAAIAERRERLFEPRSFATSPETGGSGE
jgi:hypothetical protein